jgi:hypothetical protein
MFIYLAYFMFLLTAKQQQRTTAFPTANNDSTVAQPTTVDLTFTTCINYFLLAATFFILFYLRCFYFIIIFR